MLHFSNILIFISAVLSIASIVCADRGTVRAASESRYSRTHSLGDSYKFDARDGWQTVNVTNLQYKYRRSHDSASNTSFLQARSAGQSEPQPVLKDAVEKTIKVIGSAIDVVITWWAFVEEDG